MNINRTCRYVQGNKTNFGASVVEVDRETTRKITSDSWLIDHRDAYHINKRFAAYQPDKTVLVKFDKAKNRYVFSNARNEMKIYSKKNYYDILNILSKKEQRGQLFIDNFWENPDAEGIWFMDYYI